MAGERANDHESDDSGPESAEIIAQGPILALGAFAIGVGLHQLRPISVFPPTWNFVGGGALLVAGIVIVLTGILALRRTDESPFHEEEPSELVTDGPYRYSRHPLYVGVIVAYLGLTVAFDSLWPLVTVLPLGWYFNRLAKREETFLEAKFGEEYTQYRENVRRWL